VSLEHMILYIDMYLRPHHLLGLLLM